MNARIESAREAGDEHRNIQLVEAGYEVWNSAGPAAIVEFLHPQIEWHTPFPEEASVRGHRGVRTWVERIHEVIDDVRIVPHSYDAHGDKVIVRIRVRGVAKASGIELDVPFTQVWTMRDGLPVAMRLEIEGSC